MNDILNYFGRVHAQYLHAHGKIATKVLIHTLDCKPGEKVLEIGFGTGTTLVQLYAIHKKTSFYGIERSALMHRKGLSRMRFCGIGSAVKLSLMQEDKNLPFADNSFDKVYLESVLAIQEGNDLVEYLGEIQRVLRPNGILLMNETIWLDTTPMDEILRINALGKEAFGIIQCNAQYPYVEDWQNQLQRLHWECEQTLRLDQLGDQPDVSFPFPYRFRSNAFTAIGKVRAMFSPAMRKEMKSFNQTIKTIMPQNAQLMDGYIILARNKK